MSEYILRVGDLVRSTAPPCDGVVVEQAGYGLWTIHDGKHRLGGYSVHGLTPLRPDAVGQRVRNRSGATGWVGAMLPPPRGETHVHVAWDDAGDRGFSPLSSLVRIADKAEPAPLPTCACGKPAQGTMDGRPVCEVDCPTIAAPAWPNRPKPTIVVHLDKSAPLRAKPPSTFAERKAERVAEAWPNRPLCGRPGHDPACLCTTGWVRPAEEEPATKLHLRDHWHRGERRGDEPAYLTESTWTATGSGRTAYGNTEAEAIANWRNR